MAHPSEATSALENLFRQFIVAPWTNWDNAFSPVFNPQVIISENAGDAGVEAHVLSQAGSYGKQLGLVIDTLLLLVSRIPDSQPLTPDEAHTVYDLRALAQTVDDAVATYRGSAPKGFGTADVDAVIDGVRSLQFSDPGAYTALLGRLRDFVDSNTPTPPPAKQGVPPSHGGH